MTTQNPVQPEQPSRLHGLADKVAGTVQKHAGRLLDDREMEAEGALKASRGDDEMHDAQRAADEKRDDDAPSKLRGAAEKIAGAVQKHAGRILDDHTMEAEGARKEARGDDELDDAKRSGRLAGRVEEAVGAVKKVAGEALDDAKLEAEGAAQYVKGRARQALNR